MNEQLELYKKWAPDTALWTQWAKPVVFMNINTRLSYRSLAVDHSMGDWTEYQSNRLIIVDLAGVDSIKEGLGLARKGYRPVPLFNGVPGNEKSVVPSKMIVDGLRSGGDFLRTIEINKTANPVFLLDANRLKGAKQKPGTFDNRWCVVQQDMPSANYLKKHGIDEVVVRTSQLQKDLGHLLYDYQKQGIRIYSCGSKRQIIPYMIEKPHGLGLFYRFLLLLGLSRNATGGFGMSIPEVSSGGGGYRAG